MMDADDGGTHAPFNQQVANAREDRGLTQAEVAEAVGMSLRAYGDFETGKTHRLQARNRRSLMRFFGWDRESEPADTVAESDEWPPDIRVFLDMIGAFLSRMDEESRLAWMREETRRIVGSADTRDTAARIAQEARERVRNQRPSDNAGGSLTDPVASRMRRTGGSA